jgi:sulfide dehydrogenase cytochrome subunit
MILAAAAAAAEPGASSPSYTANLAANCFGCHGPDGRSPGVIPSLYGKSAEHIAKAMKEFRAGTRSNGGTIMDRHAKGYADTEIEMLANYIAGLKR